LCGYAATEYREINTPEGKVITGLDRENALSKFGPPERASEDLWNYTIPENFFISFSSHTFSTLHLYPRRPNGSVGVPLEFKVLGYQSDTQIKDITQYARLLINKPKDFIFKGPGVIIPKKTGEYQILAEYNGIFSNPSYLAIEESSGPRKEKVVSINILPYKPVIPYKGRQEFVALAVFQDHMGRYHIKDISARADWHISQDKEVLKNRDNTIFAVSPGEADVLCRYMNSQSYPQEVSVSQQPGLANQALKHITLLPDLLLSASGEKIKLRVFGSYRDNRVEEITGKVRWETSNKNILSPIKDGESLANSAGITEVYAILDGIKSSPAKIIIADRQGSAVPPEFTEGKIEPDKLVSDIRRETNKLQEELSAEEKRLAFIKITPDTLEVPLGESAQMEALGIYSDKSREDLTNLGEWLSSDNGIVKVLGGKVSTFSQGEATVYLKFRDVKSLPAAVKVGGAKLLSIILSPQDLKISMRQRPLIKAEGYFSDSSRKDISSLVTWEFTRAGIIKIKEGKVIPLKFGSSGITAEYSGIKSLQANISVIITMGWIIYMFARWAIFLLLGIFAIFAAFYALTEEKKSEMKNCLDDDPREFMVKLYGNTESILGFFGLRRREWMTPLHYAGKVQDKYSIENDIFSKLTVKFEEAKYSLHSISRSDASCALNDYNNFIKAVLARHNKLSLFLRYCTAIFNRKPLFIPNR
jgi:hypothetical protein